MFVAGGVERFVRSLHDPLRADIDPRSCGHLSVHHESGALQFVELLPVGKMSNEIRIRDQHAGSVIVRLEHAHRLA